MGIGRLFRVELLTLVKVAAVLTRYELSAFKQIMIYSSIDPHNSFVGVILVSISDTRLESNDSTLLDHSNGRSRRPLLGDSLALLSAVFYALYVILLKVRIRSESRIDMQLFFGFVGSFNVLLCWPIGLILHLTGMEVFELPSTNQAVAAVLINVWTNTVSFYND